MEHAALLTRWESFYVIVGSSAAALTGLQFVVIVLAAELNALAGDQAASAFGTPTVVHFCAALLLSAILSAPWVELSNVAVVLGACGVAGIVYVMMAVRVMRRQTGYQPVLEDWVWHAALPFVAYVSLLVTAVLLPGRPAASLFGIGAVTLLLLFIGIHNAWDSVTYIALHPRRRAERSGDQKPD
ncbi:MAG TPA: hypothetical protein VGX68_12655 [Thermoanaerobaculia bacterium]|jgi:hypothetical protein|nr:hypothetical protein [Thermoanaerobaculia bacterium]